MSNDRLGSASGSDGEARSLVPAGRFSGVPAIHSGGVFGNRRQESQEAKELAVTIRQYLHMVLKRKWLILSLSIAFAGLGGVRASLKTPVYVATARIQIDREPIKVIEGGSVKTDTGAEYYLRTEIELLKSRAMAERVVSKLQLYEDADFFKPREVTLLGAIQAALTGPAKTDRPFAVSASRLGRWYRHVGCDYISGSRVAAR